MKRVASLTIGLALVLFAMHMFAELRTSSPITVTFGPVQEVFLNAEAPRPAAAQAKRLCFGRQFVLDAVTHDKTGRIWCKRVSEDTYKDVFYEKNVSAKALEGLQSASASYLTSLLGEPVAKFGPLVGGTAVWKWRTCNGSRGREFHALEVAAGFKGGAVTNALFLLIATGHSD